MMLWSCGNGWVSWWSGGDPRPSIRRLNLQEVADRQCRHLYTSRAIYLQDLWFLLLTKLTSYRVRILGRGA